MDGSVLECLPVQPPALRERLLSRPPSEALPGVLLTVSMEQAALPADALHIEQGEPQPFSRAGRTGVTATGRIASDESGKEQDGITGTSGRSPDRSESPEAPGSREPLLPPVIKAGSPAALGIQQEPRESVSGGIREAVTLPPMKAPYPLRGSALPDSGNNPSIVPPQVLDPPETRP